jgi:ERCC4-related helicase
MKRQIKLISSFKARNYQESIFASSIDKNSLVILPTGLGKTLIALMLSMYYFNKTNKKILFLAPTKPLVEQQKNSFENFFENSGEFGFQLLTGLVPPKKRTNLYKENDFIFSTPQLIENDILNEIINMNDFAFIIIDEAHRTRGSYAYGFIVNEFIKKGSKILALSASPGSSKEEIEELINTLNIENIQIRSYDDEDVKSYFKKTKIKKIEIEMPLEFKKISELLKMCIDKRIQELNRINIFSGKNSKNLGKGEILNLQMEIRSRIASGENHEDVWKAISTLAAILKVMHGLELFESQEISTSYNFFYNFFRDGGDTSKAAENLRLDLNFNEAFNKIKTLNSKNILHPKLIELRKIVFSKINEKKDLKIIIFAQYRDSALKIVEELSRVKEIKARIFVGQSKKGDLKMSQKEQKEVLEQFRNGEYNILVSTSVGEEGLDIPKVDMVVFYEAIPSSIRTIQRIGRTGRFDEGEVYILLSKGSKDISFSHVAKAREKRMYKALEEIKNKETKQKNEKINGLKKYMNTNNSNENNNIDRLNELDIDKRIQIYIDTRENNDLLKEFFKDSDLRVISKQLNVGDIIISEDIGIERKTKKDFVDSIIDKRLFTQLINLAKNFRRPILIIEGEDNIYIQRNISTNAIRACISSIAIDMRIPIIFTNSMEDTKEYIKSIVNRAYKNKKEIQFANKKITNEREELERFISSIPKINIISAKELLIKFNSVENLVNSSEKELEKCRGIGRKRAEFLFEFFRKNY